MIYTQSVFSTNIPYSLDICKSIMREFKEEHREDISLKRISYDTGKEIETGAVMIVKAYGYVNYWEKGIVESISTMDSPILSKLKKHRYLNLLYTGPIDCVKQNELIKYGIIAEDVLP